ncbi:olfactory receptor 56A4-like [Pleurodeles waltl]|uniref:olfactory receptor 56A4-like n=1 Tax=Pleurodeles waltl TaxID=8319 RepID=UPI0037093D09
MSSINTTSFFQIPYFVLMCFPSIQSWQHWLSITLTFLLVIAVASNLIILEVIRREQNLPEPMYHLISFLAVLDLVLCMATIPKILGVLGFNLKVIDLPTCLLQMFAMNSLVVMECATFLFMAFDWYVAICNPLRYSSVISFRFIAKSFLFVLLRGILVYLPYPMLTARLQYCSRNVNVIEHCVCTNVAVTSLACSDRTINAVYQLVIAFGILGSDFIFICLSYCLILRVVICIPVKGAARKALSTCSSHLILISFFYTLLLVLIFTNKMEKVIVPDVPILLNVLHFIIPPALNPLVYGLRTKEMKPGIMKMISSWDKSPAVK